MRMILRKTPLKVYSNLKRIKNDRCFHEEDYIHVGRVFTSGFSGRLASDKRKSREKSCFPTRLRLSGSANFSGILIKFKGLITW